MFLTCSHQAALLVTSKCYFTNRLLRQPPTGFSASISATPFSLLSTQQPVPKCWSDNVQNIWHICPFILIFTPCCIRWNHYPLPGLRQISNWWSCFHSYFFLIAQRNIFSKCKSYHVTLLLKILQGLPIPLGIKSKLHTRAYRTPYGWVPPSLPILLPPSPFSSPTILTPVYHPSCAQAFSLCSRRTRWTVFAAHLALGCPASRSHVTHFFLPLGSQLTCHVLGKPFSDHSGEISTPPPPSHLVSII